MLRISVDNAVPRMTLALPVLHPEKPEHLLLKPGAELDMPAIEKMREMGVRRIWIRYPPTDFLLRYASPRIIAEHGRMASRLAGCFDAVATDTHADLEFTDYASTVRSFAQAILDEPNAAVFLGDILDSGAPLVAHSSNVCYLSLLMALKLDGYLISERPLIGARRAQNVENLGVGAMLHDVGMLRLAPEVVADWERTRDETDTRWQKHAALGFDTVRGKVAPTAAAAVLHHHQRMDGTGFPKRPRIMGPPRPLAGGEIHVFARIIAVADVFDRFRNPPRPPGTEAQRVPTVRALRQTLAQVRAGKLDPVVFKALLAVVPAFAPGSLVELSDGTACVVVSWDPTRPCEPVVQIVPDPEDFLRPRAPTDDPPRLGHVIDLRNRRDVAVALAEGEHVGADSFHARNAREFDLRYQFVGGVFAGALPSAAAG
jgi:HD-GYP domain-containing protein (c-di-GMP phosphodiesterase class II)